MHRLLNKKPVIAIYLAILMIFAAGISVYVDAFATKTPCYVPEETAAETTEAQTLDISYIVLTEEEADECIAKLREEKNIIRKEAKASYVKKKEAHSDQSNRYYLAAAICREVGGLSDHVKMLVGNVIMNRVASPYFPNSIYGVLTQKYQYGMMWKNGISFPSWVTQKEIDRCYAVADHLLAGERICPANVIFQAEFVQGSGVYEAVDGVYFCYG